MHLTSPTPTPAPGIWSGYQFPIKVAPHTDCAHTCPAKIGAVQDATLMVKCYPWLLQIYKVRVGRGAWLRSGSGQGRYVCCIFVLVQVSKLLFECLVNWWQWDKNWSELIDPCGCTVVLYWTKGCVSFHKCGWNLGRWINCEHSLLIDTWWVVSTGPDCCCIFRCIYSNGNKPKPALHETFFYSH